MNIGAITALIIIAVILAVSLKSKNPEISSLMSVAVGIVIIALCVGRIGTILEFLDRISGYIKVDKEYIAILLKLIGIAYICEFASGISKDAGYSSVASQIELMGKLTMLVTSLPVLIQVLDMILDMM